MGSGIESRHANCFGNTLGYKTNSPEEQNTPGKHPGTLSKHSWPQTSFHLNSLMVFLSPFFFHNLIKHSSAETWHAHSPTLDRATCGNVSMTRLVSSPVCPALWPFKIRAAVTVGIPIPAGVWKHSRASAISHSVNIIHCGSQRQVSNINSNAAFLFKAGFHSVVRSIGQFFKAYKDQFMAGIFFSLFTFFIFVLWICTWLSKTSLS